MTAHDDEENRWNKKFYISILFLSLSLFTVRSFFFFSFF